jgi:DNA-binding FadR family transcriptional regulator
VQAVRDLIVEQGLRAGDPLPAEGDLAERFGVGRNSVREAVKALEVLGIIEARPGAGLFVRNFSFDPIVDNLPYAVLVDLKDLADLLEVRRHLEIGMAARFVQCRTDAQLETLQGILNDWEVQARGGLYSSEADRAFHDALCAQAGNALMRQILDVFWRAFHRASNQEAVAAPRDPMETFSRHLPIIDALSSGDSDDLRYALNQHYEGIRRRIAASKALTTSLGSTSNPNEVFRKSPAPAKQ